MKIIRLMVAGFFILYCNTKLLAQATDSVDVTIEEITSPESLKDTILLADTVLHRYEFETDDSLGVYKMDRDFVYMKYLDSLLRVTKDLKVDTFSTEYGSSRSKRKARQNNGGVNVPQADIFSNLIVKIILWIAAVFLIGFLIFKLFLGDNFFRRDRTYKNISDTPKEADNLDASDYDKLITEAVAIGNYRLAIRYRYLQTLQKLSDNGLVQFSTDKTNYQYVKELRGQPLQNDFAAITLNYEYVWYGKFEINKDAYNRLSGEYKLFHQKI